MRSTILTVALAALTAAAAAPADADAQLPLSLELRGSLNNPVGDFGDEGNFDATSEAGLGADLIYNATSYLSVYGGWSRSMYGCETCGDDGGLHSQGFEGGLKLLANREEGVLPWARAGLIAHDLTYDAAAVDVTSDTGIGFQAAAGVDIPLGDVLSFSPALRYQAYDAEFDADFDIGEVTIVESTVQHLSLDFGLHIHLAELGRR